MNTKTKKYSPTIFLILIYLNICRPAFAQNSPGNSYRYHKTRKAIAVDSALDLVEQQLQGGNSAVRLPDGSIDFSESWRFSDYANTDNQSPFTMGEDIYTDPYDDPCSSEDPYASKDPYSKGGSGKTSNSNDSPAVSFLKNIDYGMILQTGEKPNVYVEGVLPIYQSTDKRNTFFTHNRISVQGDNGGSFSGGLGYRQLIRDDKLLVGANTFLDYQRGQKHSRIGLGMEALADDYEIRSNVYLRLSSEKLVNETDIYRYYEKVANGYDFEVGGRYPSLPWLKTFIGYSKYYFDNSEDPRRVKGRIEIKPSNLLTINIIGHRNQATDTNHFGVDGRLSFAFDTFKPEDMWRSITNSWKPDWMENPVMPDLMSRALDRVERNFDIVIEEWTEDKITPIAVGSGGSLQIQLIWDRNNMNDMDLHLLLPAGVGDNDHIFWFADESYIGADLFANLDVDDIPLSGGHVDHPGRDHVENIYVVSGMMQPGTYTPYVHVYDFTSNVTATINVFREGAFVATYTHTFTADEQIYNLPVITYP